jgi:glycine/D-amino acid oxidase-like deaminating enzyme
LPGLAAFHPAERISVWMGHRTNLPDSLPVLGPSRATPDILYAFGHGHVGMTAAPMTGKLVTALVTGRPPSIDMAPFGLLEARRHRRARIAAHPLQDDQKAPGQPRRRALVPPLILPC